MVLRGTYLPFSLIGPLMVQREPHSHASHSLTRPITNAPYEIWSLALIYASRIPHEYESTRWEKQWTENSQRETEKEEERICVATVWRENDSEMENVYGRSWKMTTSRENFSSITLAKYWFKRNWMKCGRDPHEVGAKGRWMRKYHRVFK